METPTATSLADRIRYALASPIASDDILDPHKELAEVLKTVGLEPSSSGGTIIFHGKDPILKSPWPLATMASVGLMAKAQPKTLQRFDRASSTWTCLCMGRPGRGVDGRATIRMQAGVSGIFVREGTFENPSLTEIFVVNDYVMSWLSCMAVLTALKRRATEGGSYRIHISLARLSTWLLHMGIFDKAYAREIGNTTGEHAYLSPELFAAETPCGNYQGVTDQVQMSETPGFYKVPLVPRGSSQPAWLPRS